MTTSRREAWRGGRLGSRAALLAIGIITAIACSPRARESARPQGATPWSLPRAELVRMAVSGGDWLLRVQRQEGPDRGRFLYEIDPTAAELPHGFENDNFLRQAGATYSLVLLHESTGEPRFLEGARRGAGYLLSRLTTDPEVPGRAWFDSEGGVKLGGSALPMLTLIKLKVLLSTSDYDEAIGRVASFLLAMQREDGGFRSYHARAGPDADRGPAERDSSIYPGEAMLALTRLYALTRDERFREAVDRAREFYAARDELCLRPSFIPWTTTAMVEMHALTGDPRSRDLAFRMNDHLIATCQQLDPSHPFFGAFHGRPSVNTATYLEGILDAYRLAVGLGDEERGERYRTSADAGFTFLRTLQLDADRARRFGDRADLVVGAFQTATDGFTVRIDGTQHAVSALLKGIAACGLADD